MIVVSVSKSNNHFNPRQQLDFVTTSWDESVLTRSWSPIVWRGGRRKKSNFESCQIIALDFDDGKMSLEQCREALSDAQLDHVIATTKSHQKEKNGLICDRFRALLFLSVPITDLHQYEEHMRWYSKRYPCDRSAIDGGRFFYPCTEVIYRGEYGVPFDPIVFPPQKPKPPKRYPDGNIKFPDWVTKALIQGVEKGRRNNMTYAIARFFGECGYSLEETEQRIINSSITLEERELKNAVNSGWRDGQASRG